MSNGSTRTVIKVQVGHTRWYKLNDHEVVLSTDVLCCIKVSGKHVIPDSTE